MNGLSFTREKQTFTALCWKLGHHWTFQSRTLLFCLDIVVVFSYTRRGVFCHACHASSVTTQFSIVARYHGIDFPCDLGIVIVLSCSLVKTLSRFTAKIYFE